MFPTTPASVLGARYLPHIADICARLAHEAARHRCLAPLLVLVWFRLRRMLARLDRLADRWQRGRLRPPRRSTPRTAPAETRLPRHTPPRHTPRGHAWLIRLHQPLAQFAPRVQLLLDDPEIAALCAAAPQAARLLRPLCQMFGLSPPYLRRPENPHAPSRPHPHRRRHRANIPNETGLSCPSGSG